MGIKLSFYALIFSLALGQLAALSKSDGSNIYAFDIVCAGYVILGLFYILVKKLKFRFPQNFLYFGLFTVLAAVTLFINSPNFSSEQLLISGFYLVRYVSYLFAALITYNFVLLKKLKLDEIKKTYVFSAVFLLILGFIQLIILPDFEQLDQSLGWDPHKNRMASTFYDPNFLGAYFVSAIFLTFEFIKINKRYLAVLLSLIVGLILTFSRSAWLMMGIGILIYGILKNKKLLFISLLIAFLTYYSIPRIQTRLSGTTDPADSAQFRIVSWNQTWKIIKDNPVTGVGFNTLRYVQKEYGFIDSDTFTKHSASGSDSSILFVFATTGVLGLLMFLYGYFRPFITKQAFKKNLVYTTILLALLVESQFINSLFYPQILLMWLIISWFNYL